MRVAIYIESGVAQLVLTPDTEWEKDITKKMLPDGGHDLTIHRGSFYECRGGWFRHGLENDSLILRVDAKPPQPVPMPVDPFYVPSGGVCE